MNNLINYFVEANFSLILFFLLYLLLFRKETNFSAGRSILLGGIFLSLTLPLLHIRSAAITLPVADVIPTIVLPEFNLGAVGNAETTHEGFSTAHWLLLIYAAGFTLCLVRFMVSMYKLLALIKHSTPSSKDGLLIAEQTATPPFSFFNYISIGQCQQLSDKEKEQIIAHERIHAQQYHSFDILLLNILGIFFWFNPVLRYYKNIFIQLHEFEADARSVRSNEVDDYCNLLARVALLSADLRIANHFSNSLTLKRIQMMRKSKLKIKPWKLMAFVVVLPILFFMIACHDQIAGEVTEIAKSSTVALDVPPDIQAKYDELKAAHPDKNLLLVEVDANGKAKVESLKQKMDNLPPESISSVNVFKHPATATENERAFIIVEYSDNVKNAQEASKTDEGVYTIVDDTALPEGGLEKFYEFVGDMMTYPTEAKVNGVQGKVFISFIVEPDGSLSDIQVMKSVHKLLDDEALRVVQNSPRWDPGKNNGTPVRQRLVLPINFNLDDEPKP